FRRVVRPGDVLKLHIKLTKKRENMGIVETKAVVNGENACLAELMFVVAERNEKI
ncbi:MAG: 3-hydroxyacyl-[acyl-carrier-protein] dehydratase FabZ, partial [Liquorilactobacillus satsumensis]